MTERSSDHKRTTDSEAPRAPELAGVIHENVRSIQELRNEVTEARTFHHRFTERVFNAVGSIGFVYFELAFIGIWFVINTGNVPFIPIFDEYPFVFLATILGAKAIFLTVFILAAQNRLSIIDKKREDLNLQMTLLTEHEVTRLIGVIHAMAKHLKIPLEEEELRELKREVSPEKVIGVIEDEEKRAESELQAKKTDSRPPA